jgi:transposase
MGHQKKREAGDRKSRGGWNTKIHALMAGDREVVGFSLSPGNAIDTVTGRLLLATVGLLEASVSLHTDRAYEGAQTRLTARRLGFTSAVPPKSNRRNPWPYDWEVYKRRTEVERFFRRLQAFRCVGTRYDKPDVVVTAFIHLAIIGISLRNVNTPQIILLDLARSSSLILPYRKCFTEMDDRWAQVSCIVMEASQFKVM